MKRGRSWPIFKKVFQTNLGPIFMQKFQRKFTLTLNFFKHWPWSSLVEGGEVSYLPNCQTNLGRYEPSPPSTKELHALAYNFEGPIRMLKMSIDSRCN